MDIKYNNSAGRLLAILQCALSENSERTTSTVWGTVFNEFIEDKGKKIHRDNYAEVNRRLVVLLESLNEIEDAMRLRKPDDQHLYLSDFHSLKMALAPRNLQAKWEEVRSHVTSSSMISLELCAKEFSSEGDVSRDDIRAILSAVQELRRNVRESDDLSVLLKEWLLQVLATVERAIELYDLRGARKLRDALASLAGEMFFNPYAKKELEKNSSFARQVANLAGLLLDAVQRAQQIEALIGYSGQAGELIGLMITNLPT